ncbi:MAG: hypothetical protein AAGF94_18105 [Pseudomonadota bacterium]
MPEDAAPIGHNLPPAFDPHIVAELKRRTDEFLKATQVWLDLPDITDETSAQQITDQIGGLRGLHKSVEDARKAAKKPHDDAGRAVQDAFTPMSTKLKSATEQLKAKLGTYVTRRAEEERQQKEAEAAEAERREEEAKAALAAAQQSNDVGGQVDAQAALEQAEKDAAIAAKGPSTSVASMTGAGRTLAQRTVKQVTITNINVLFLHFRDDPRIAEVLRSFAAEAVRKKDYVDGSIPGIEVTEIQQIA